MKKPPVKLILLVTLVASGIALSQWGPFAHLFAPENLRACVTVCRASGWGVPVFVLLFVAGSMMALPAVGFIILGGAIFGFWHGVLYNLIGCNLGALAAFAVARALGRETVRSWIKGDKLARLERIIERHGCAVIVAFRILPILPYNAVNFGSALLKIRWTDYALGTLVGTVPATLLFTYYATVPGGGRDRRIETAVVALAIGAIAGSWWTVRNTLREEKRNGR